MSFWSTTAPNWLASVGTISATGVAVWLAFGERRRAMLAEAERDELRAEKSKEVARQVVAWLVEGDVPSSTDLQSRPWRIVLRNGSDQPVFEVAVGVMHDQGKKWHQVMALDVLPPGQTSEYVLPFVPIAGSVWPYGRVVFTDPNGQRWARGRNGALVAGYPDVGFA